VKTAPAIPEKTRAVIERWISEPGGTYDLRVYPVTLLDVFVDRHAQVEPIDAFPEPIVLYRQRQAAPNGARLVRDVAVRQDTQEVVARGGWYYPTREET